MPAGKHAPGAPILLLALLTLATLTLPGGLLGRPQPAQASTEQTPTRASGEAAFARTINPFRVQYIPGLSKARISPLPDRVIPLNSPPVTPVGSGDTAPTSPVPAVGAPDSTANFEGLHTTTDCVIPPDSDGTVGPTYYVAIVNNYNNCATQSPMGNVGFFCKEASGGQCPVQGTLAAAFYYPKLFIGVTTPCSDPTAHSDPQVVYDSAKDRYLFEAITLSAPYQLCIATTLSNDPVNGDYCIASYATLGPSIPDYPKAGVWIDGYYIGYNPQSTNSGDSRTVVFNKDDFESCKTIRLVDFDMGSSGNSRTNQCTPQPNHIFRPVPATYRLVTGIPSAGEPGFVLSAYCDTSSGWVSTLAVNWATQTGTIKTSKITVQTDNFAPATVLSPSPGNALDTLRLHWMTPAPYFKDSNGNEYLWITKTVRGSSSSLSAIAWYQLKVVNNAPASTTVANQNIWNPDATSRLQAAAAFDRAGNVLMDYSQVSTTLKPALAYAGRLTTDGANMIGQSEKVLFRGPTMGSGSCNGTCTRWGDYSSNFIDVDGCTFWFTHEYYNVSDPWQWDTRIGATRYATCTPLTYSRTVSPAVLAFTGSIGHTSPRQNITVTNTGTGPLVVQGPVVNGTGAADFTIASDSCSTAPFGVASGISCRVQVMCTPSVQGFRTATLSIKTNVAAADLTSIPLSCTSSTVSGNIIVLTNVPVAMFRTNFTATATGGAGGYSYSWTFGDGATGTGQAVSHVYSSNGTFTVKLTVTDSAGAPFQSSTNLRVDLNPDFDGNGVVNIVDAAHLAQVYGTTAGDGVYDPAFDLTWDGKIDILDAAIEAFYFDKTVGS